MPRKSMDTLSIPYGDLYEDESRYLVPRFQRDYNWKTDHIDEFWNDLVKHWNSEDRTPYYFGSVMLVNEDESDPTFRVVDGQQRMVTSMIFFVALRDYFLEREDKDEVKELNYIIYYEDENKQLQSRLQLNRYNNPFFQQKIIPPGTITSKKSSMIGDRVKNRALANCYKQIAERISEYANNVNIEEKDDNLRDLYDHLTRNFLIIQNIFSTKQRAYRIFETINHKGLQLDENDLVKNYLMELIDDTNSVEESQDIIDADNKWGDIMSKLEDVKIKEDFFLRIHLTACGNKTPKDKIYDTIVDQIKNSTDAQGFIDDLEKSADFLFKIKKTKNDDWKDDQEIIDNLNGLNALSDGGMYPILLAAQKNPEFDNIKKLIELVVKLHFRAKTVCSRSYTSIEGLVVKICNQLKNSNTYYISDIQKDMVSWSQYPNDDEFEVQFRQLELSSTAKAKYVLMEMEYSKIGGRKTASTQIVTDIQVEHIMPKSIEGDWRDELIKRSGLETAAKVDDYHKRNLKRLGNLTLLSSNAIIQNDGYQKKLNGNGEYPGYRDDRLKITSSLAQYDQWNEEVMKAREADFYVHAKKIWNLKLCDV